MSRPVRDLVTDPYLRCEDVFDEKGKMIKHGSCTHDLARGVLLEELRGEQGPYPPLWDHKPMPPLLQVLRDAVA